MSNPATNTPPARLDPWTPELRTLIAVAGVLWILLAAALIFLLCAPADPLNPDLSAPSPTNSPAAVFYPAGVPGQDNSH